jgi:predicted transcriptional regulator
MKTNMQQTSIFAYHSLGDLTPRQAEVLAAIKQHGPIANYDLAMVVWWPVNCVTGRVLELRDKGLVVEAYRGRHKVTGRQVIFWKAMQS